ncbi:MAG: VanZ family protein [Aristaeellaceae bacterium]
MSSVEVILSLVVLLAVGAALVQAVNALFAQERQFYRQNYHRDRLIVDVVVVVLYALFAALVGTVYVAFHYEPLVLYLTMLCLVVITLVLLIRYILKHRESLVRGALIAFLVWFGVVLYLTLFSRIGDKNRVVVDMTPFRWLSEAIAAGSLEPMQHFLLNVLLFLPFGYLLPCMDPRHLSRISFAALSGLVASTVIETIQMVAGLGWCDMDDIIANALGAAIGYGLYRLLAQIRKNWLLT